MELWLDTCNVHLIKTAFQYGFIHGITTNPSILAAAKGHYKTIITDLLDAQDGPVAVQVTASIASDIVQQAVALHTFSDRIVVKIPVIQQGLLAMRVLKEKEVPMMATAIYHPNQVLLAAMAEVDYAAPYIGRMHDAGNDIYADIQTMQSMISHYQFRTKILGAALRNPEQITLCAKMGVQSITIKDALFNELFADHPSAVQCLQLFQEEWKIRCDQAEVAELSL